MNTQTTKGIVKKYEKLNHSSVYYDYHIGSDLFHGVGSAEGYDLGDEINILFSVDSPHISDISENVPSPSGFFTFAILISSFVSIASICVIKINDMLSSL